MLPSVVVLMGLFWTPVMVVSAYADEIAKGAANNAAVAAESIRRCFVKIQTSLFLAKDARGARANP